MMYENIDGPINVIGNSITRADYPGGNTLFVWDLTPDLDSSHNFHLLKSGNLSIHLQWAENLATPITLVVYLEFDNILRINKLRNSSLELTQ